MPDTSRVDSSPQLCDSNFSIIATSLLVSFIVTHLQLLDGPVC